MTDTKHTPTPGFLGRFEVNDAQTRVRGIYRDAFDTIRFSPWFASENEVRAAIAKAQEGGR